MTCRVTIVAQAVKQAVVVPTPAVFSTEAGDFCYVRTGWGGYEKRAITAGAQNEDVVQVVAGLEPGEKVSLVPPQVH